MYVVEYIKRHQMINELEETMNFTKINNDATATSAIRNGNYIIGSITNGVVSLAENPTVHFDSSTARVECKRLARLNPGSIYFFSKLSGAEMVPTNSISI